MKLIVSKHTLTNIEMMEDPFLIVDGETVVGVYEGKEQARSAKSAEAIKGKIVDGAKCDFEVAGETPDETIAPEAEEEIAAELDAEESAAPYVTPAMEVAQAVAEAVAAEPVETVKQKRARSEAQIAAQTASKALDRRIICLDTGEVFKSAYAMFTQNRDWMNIGQRNKMTTTLLNAAKAGDKIVVEVNGRNFQLVNV